MKLNPTYIAGFALTFAGGAMLNSNIVVAIPLAIAGFAIIWTAK